MKSYIISDAFYPGARALRAEFNEAFRDPRRTDAGRFVWDFWYQHEQYRHLRTPAMRFFSEPRMQAFLTRLTRWGQQNLGCSALSPPWLSYYVDGCFQSLHGDVPHGPFAYVYSLTLNSRAFRGGRTLLLKDSILDFWKSSDLSQGFEHDEVLHRIENKFNRLVVFDPRIPHGVEETHGVIDPLESRVVLHGWFTEPMPFVEGGLTGEKVVPELNARLKEFFRRDVSEPWHGLLTLKLSIGSQGRVNRVATLVNTLQRGAERDKFVRHVHELVKTWHFPKARGASRLTLPLYFK